MELSVGSQRKDMGASFFVVAVVCVCSAGNELS
jgi:hypothetical protein